MRTILTTALALALAVGVAIPQEKGKGGAKGKGGPGFTLRSPAFEDGGLIPDKYTQAVGLDAPSPALTWTNVPAGTQSFVLWMHDLDVARNKGLNDQLHWLAWDIPADATGLPEGVKPEVMSANGMMQSKNGGNTLGYRPPGAPAPGPEHHYTFELFALDTKLGMHPPDSDTFQQTLDKIKAAMEGHVNGRAILMGRFKRPQ